MHSWADALEIGFVRRFDEIALMARGDLLTVVYGADASLRRSVWIFGAAEKLISQTGHSIQALLIVPPGTKPPDSATRDAESAAYRRLGSQLRRVVAVPEGGGFRVSIVRLVFHTHAAVTGQQRVFTLAKDLDDAQRLLRESATVRTPTPDQIVDDILKIRTELNR